MSANSTTDGGILYEVRLESSQGVNWNWVLPYRVQPKDIKQDGHITASRPQFEEYRGKRERSLREGTTSRKKSSLKGKIKFRTHSRLKITHKPHGSETQLHQRKVGESLRMVRQQQSSRTLFGPQLEVVSTMLPCEIPDDFLKPQLPKSQWPSVLPMWIQKPSINLTLEQLLIPSPKWCHQDLQVQLIASPLP